MVAESGRGTKSVAFRNMERRCIQDRVTIDRDFQGRDIRDRDIMAVDLARRPRELIHSARSIVASGIFSLPVIHHGCCLGLQQISAARVIRGAGRIAL